MCTSLDRLSVLIADNEPIYVDGLKLAVQSMAQKLRFFTASSTQEIELHLNNHIFDLIFLGSIDSDASLRELALRYKNSNSKALVVVISDSYCSQGKYSTMASESFAIVSRKISCENFRRFLTSKIDKKGSFQNQLPQASLRFVPRITPRQREILSLLALGLTNKLIARKIGICEETVKAHLKVLFRELDVHTRTSCIMVARQYGFI